VGGHFVAAVDGDDRSTWSDPKIIEDSRIEHDRWLVRAVAERLHGLESMHMHQDIADRVCVYCALRASNAIRVLTECEVLR
jgi:hypothetical protein